MNTVDTISALIAGACVVGLVVVPQIAVRRNERAIDREIKDRRLAKVARAMGSPVFVTVDGAAYPDPWGAAQPAPRAGIYQDDECDPRLSGPGDAGPPARCYTGPNEYRHDAESLEYMQRHGVGG